MSFLYMMNRPTYTSPPLFWGEVGKYKHQACQTTALLSFAVSLLPIWIV